MGKRSVSFPELDAVRTLCFLSVFFFHALYATDPAVIADARYRFFKVHLFGDGGLGVNVFFVLSGFLITYLLLAEKRLNGRIDVPRFWLRRVLRIWPLYYATLVVGFFLIPAVKAAIGQPEPETADLLHYLTFTGNFDQARGEFPASSVVSILWSIAVEEQFYLFWPVLIAIVPERRLPWLFASVVAMGIVFRGIVNDAFAYECHTLSCVNDMAIGGWASMALFSERGRSWVAGWGRPTILLLHLAFLVLYIFRDKLLMPWFIPGILDRTLFAASAASLLLYQVQGMPTRLRLTHSPVLQWAGRISYGLYCLHPIAVLVAIQVMQRTGLDHTVWCALIWQPGLALVLTFVLAWASHRWFERPFLRLKDRFAYIVRG
ncbi:MAG: acyltransferase [Flavobacteriales bacterium]|nr:acyltransferase [Flavobacteriales bacterium]